MNAKRSDSDAAAAGLCAGCRFGVRQRSARGGDFWRCQRAEDDASFERYPRLPVERCRGFEPTIPVPHAR